MKDIAVRMREEGAPVREIAKALDLPRSTVGMWIVGIDPLPHALPGDESPNPDDDRLARLHATCSRCYERKPWSEFWAAARWPDGTMRRPQSRCKACVKARRREQRREDPERIRERGRRDWQLIMADPARRARRKETQRENSVAFRRRQAEQVHVVSDEE